jgi:hypothetical protein
MIDAAQHLTARTMVFSNAERVQGLPGVKPKQAYGHRCAADGIPGPRSVVVGDACMQRDTGPRRDLIAYDEASQECAAVDLRLAIREREERWQQGRAGMALGQRVAVMRIQRIDR